MSPADARMLVLAAEIERDLAQVERHAGEILREAALPIAGLRPAIFPEGEERAWGELLGFRHFLHEWHNSLLV